MNATEPVRGVRIVQSGSRLTIRWRRLSRLTGSFGSIMGEVILFLLGLALFIPVAASFASRLVRWEWSAFQWTDLFSALFLIFGVLLLYRALGLALNTDIIEATPETLKARSVPLPFSLGEAAKIPLKDIQKVESKIRIASSNNRNKRGVTRYYDIVVITYDGKSVVLAGGSVVPETTIFVAQEITEFLEKLRPR